MRSTEGSCRLLGGWRAAGKRHATHPPCALPRRSLSDNEASPGLIVIVVVAIVALLMPVARVWVWRKRKRAKGGSGLRTSKDIPAAEKKCDKGDEAKVLAKASCLVES